MDLSEVIERLERLATEHDKIHNDGTIDFLDVEALHYAVMFLAYYKKLSDTYKTILEIKEKK